MQIRIKHILLALLIGILLLLTVGIYLPRYISKKHSFIGITAGHIYVDNATDKTIPDKDMHTCYFLLTHGGGWLAALGSGITQRMAITATRDLETGNCGACSAKLYTFFNLKYLHTQAHRSCGA
jgi:hypothetical protein